MSIFEQILQPRPAGPGEDELHAPPRAWLWLARARRAGGSLTRVARLPELAVVIAVAATLDFWDLSRNGWANSYYSAAVRSMSVSWHNFLYASLDPSGVMTIDKPPLAIWVEALSVRVFGYHPLAILIPEALIGVATVVLLYDLVRRLFGRLAGTIAGIVLATTPITVAMSRHNNPDALVALCCVAALWCFVRAVQDGRTRWIVLSGVMVGLGFEAKMAVALVVVPGIVLAWLWLRPRGLRGAIDQLVAGGIAMLVSGGAWPLLVALTPAVQRPWVSGTSNNSILSLIFGYNGFGRIGGQRGGPISGALGVFAGAPTPFRLLNAALGGQDGWFLGSALLGGLAIVAVTRLRRSDPRSAGVIALGGAFLVTAALFTVAHGIFHPYYVSLLAPFTAALVGAALGQLLTGRLGPRLLAALVLAAGVACELVVLDDYAGQLQWIVPLLLGVGGVSCLALLAASSPRVGAVAITAALAALLVAPSIWAVDTLGYSTSGTFPAGGPESDNTAMASIVGRGLGIPPGGHRPGLLAAPPGAAFGPAATPPGSSSPFAVNDPELSATLAWVRTHGGGTVAIASQSNAAGAIIAQDADVAGIGGWSGRESDPSVAWFAQEVNVGRIRWVYDEGHANFIAAYDGRPGAGAVLRAARRACVRVIAYGRVVGLGFGDGPYSRRALYDCAGRGAELGALGG